MNINHVDPVDHSRTTRQHAGETVKNGANAPGLVLMALGIVTLALSLAGFATGRSDAAVIGVVVAVVVAGAGGAWLFLAHRRVRKNELRRAASEPQVEAPPPTR